MSYPVTHLSSSASMVSDNQNKTRTEEPAGHGKTQNPHLPQYYKAHWPLAYAPQFIYGKRGGVLRGEAILSRRSRALVKEDWLKYCMIIYSKIGGGGGVGRKTAPFHHY